MQQITEITHKSPRPHFSDEYFLTLAEMKAYDERWLFNGRTCYVEEKECYYEYNSKNEIDELTGRWRIHNVWKAGKGDHSAETTDTGCQAEGDYSTAEGFQSYTIKDDEHEARKGKYAHAEGSMTNAGGNSSHAEGENTVTNNPYEHAEGVANKSNSEDPDIFGLAGNTLHSVGIGFNGDPRQRKNAEEIMQNGDQYIFGIGGYDGTNYDKAKTVQEVIENPVKGYYDKDTDTFYKDEEYEELIEADNSKTYINIDEKGGTYDCRHSFGITEKKDKSEFASETELSEYLETFNSLTSDELTALVGVNTEERFGITDTLYGRKENKFVRFDTDAEHKITGNTELTVTELFALSVENYQFLKRSEYDYYVLVSDLTKGDFIEQVLNLEDSKIIPSEENLNKRVFTYKSVEAAVFTPGVYRITDDNLIALEWDDYFKLPVYSETDYEDCIALNVSNSSILDIILSDWYNNSQMIPVADQKNLYFTCNFDYTDFESKRIKITHSNIQKGALYHFVVSSDSPCSIEAASYSDVLNTSAEWDYNLYNYPQTVSGVNFCFFAIDGSALQPNNSMVGKAIVISNSSYTLPETNPAMYKVAYNEKNDSYFWQEVDDYIFETNELRKYDHLLNAAHLGYQIYQFSNIQETDYSKPRATYQVAFDGTKYYWRHVGDRLEQVSKLEDSVIIPSKDTLGKVVYLNQNEISNSYKQSIYIVGRDKDGNYAYTEPEKFIELARYNNIGVGIGTPCSNELDFNNMITAILEEYESDSNMDQMRFIFQNTSSYAVKSDSVKMPQGPMGIVLGVNYPGQEGVWAVDTDFALTMSHYTTCKDQGVTFNTDFLYPDTYGVVDELLSEDLIRDNMNKVVILSQNQEGNSKSKGWYEVVEKNDGGLTVYDWAKQTEGMTEGSLRVAKDWVSAYNSVIITNGMVYVKANLELQSEPEEYDPIIIYNLPNPRQVEYIHITSSPYWSECQIPASIDINGNLKIEGGLEPSSLWIDVVYPLSTFVSQTKSKN